ncbi:MAG: hypothetical protein ACI85I_002232 [Arenicella sp.]|jgi:hypothetical protein
MKNLLILFGILLATSTYAQTTNTTVTSDKSTHTSTQNGKVESSSSITNSEGIYKFEGSYTLSKHKDISKFIFDALGKPDSKSKSNKSEWPRRSSGKKTFYCKLENGKMELILYTSKIEKGFCEKINKLGDELRKVVSSHEPHKH